MDSVIFALVLLALVQTGMIMAVLLRVYQPPQTNQALTTQIALLSKAMETLPKAIREEALATRNEIKPILLAQTDALEKRIARFEDRVAAAAHTQTTELSTMRTEGVTAQRQTRLEQREMIESVGMAQTTAINKMSDTMGSLQKSGNEAQTTALETIGARIGHHTEATTRQHEAMRDTVSKGLEAIRAENAERLEKMRETVDEKLHGTLERRLGESFQLVSERLEAVQKGLGEMTTLATGVGDLKRVLSNVKSRGGWGEVQLGMILEDVMTPDQYASNVRVHPESTEVVEYAIKLPGRSDDNMPILLPIDAKFPNEDYERLLNAQESGNVEHIEQAGAAIERAIRLQAKTISEKYIHPPHSTDFAIMYLPTEGLFAEVIRRPGLANDLQTKHRILIQGPTTLAALLNSLQMGFRTLAIEKRSSEVWQILGAAKAEFEKYGDVWDKLGKQLDTARKTVEEAGRRTRSVTRRLREVETIDTGKEDTLDLLTSESDKEETEEVG